MAKSAATINGQYRTIKKEYATLNGTYTKIKKAYATINGKWEKVLSGDFEYSYTGEKLFFGDPEGDWELVLLTSGKLDIKSVGGPLQVFLEGGGGPGAIGKTTRFGNYGGGGGEGGESVTATVPVEEGIYDIRIGQSGENTTAFGITARAGAPGDPQGNTTHTHNGGYGGAGTRNGQAGNGGTGNLAFGDGKTFYKPGFRYGGGAAGSGGFYQDGPVVGIGKPGIGGTNGGADGTIYTDKIPKNGEKNSGGGGSGMYAYAGVKSSGGSGIIIIRNARGAA